VEIGKQPLARGVHELGVEIAQAIHLSWVGVKLRVALPAPSIANLRSESQLRLIIQHGCGRKRAPLR
jgi:hypothetical protein